MTGPDMQLHRDIGRLEGRVASLESQVAGMNEMVTAMHDAMMQAKGGWKLVFIIGSAVGAIAASVAGLFGVLHK